MHMLDGAMLRQVRAAPPPILAAAVRGHGLLHAEAGPFLLEVHPGESSGYARFLVRRRRHDAPTPASMLLSSGSKEDSSAALSSAEQAMRRVECL